MLIRIKKSMVSRFNQWQMSRRIEAAHSHSFENESGQLSAIQHIISEFHQREGLKHRFQAYKLLALHKLLETYQPSNILELGTGSSTQIFMAYLASHSQARLTCVDENQYWLDMIIKDAADRKLSKRVRTHNAERQIIDSSVAEFRYRDIPESKPDFIFVDGPSHLLAKQNLKEAVDTNALDLVKAGAAPTIVVSARRATVRYFREKLTKYDMHESDLLNENFYPNYNYFTIFTPSKHVL